MTSNRSPGRSTANAAKTRNARAGSLTGSRLPANRTLPGRSSGATAGPSGKPGATASGTSGRNSARSTPSGASTAGATGRRSSTDRRAAADPAVTRSAPRSETAVVQRPPRPRPAPYPMSARATSSPPINETTTGRRSSRPAIVATAPASSAHRPWTTSIRRRRSIARTARTPRASTAARPARPPTEPRPSARTRAPATRYARTGRRVAQRDDVAVVDGGQALDQVDDGRHARLVPLDDETRNDDRDVQAPRGHTLGAKRGRSISRHAKQTRAPRCGPGWRACFVSIGRSSTC